MKSIGELLRERREAFGADRREAARWCGEAPDWLEDKETRSDLSALDFERICRGLAISPAALLHGESDTPTRSVTRFRSALEGHDVLTSNDLGLLATASEIGMALAEVMAAQGKPLPFGQYRNLRAPSTNLPPREEGYELGEAARALLIPHEGPAVELERALAELGVHVARVRFSTSEIEAASIREYGAVPVILLNTGATKVAYKLSRRACLAHEMCHLLHDGGKADIATRVTCPICSNLQDAIEKRARGFAPAFLAPRKQVHEWAQTVNLPTEPPHLVYELASYWGLSFEGAIWHAKNCRLIESEIAFDLAEMNIQPAMDMERFETEPVCPRSLTAYPELQENLSPLMEGFAAKMVIEAFEESAISFGRAKELLSWG
ncbi:MAG: XRE family transcriptional regulator [Syntrophobacteraceae bacterium]|nr:XRE family transcriptional regulator [Syntrophobacteraceae bacterium]